MKLRKKMKKQNGFTLIEMLIVVAIIAILVAVSIPIVNTALEKTREATDAANERAAKAEILVQYLSQEDFNTDETYYYDAVQGTLSDTKPVTAGYGKCSDHKNGFITVKLDVETAGKETVTILWTECSEGEPHKGVVGN